MYKSENIEENEDENSSSEYKDNIEDNNSLAEFEYIDNQNLEFSINDYIEKLRKNLLLIDRTNQNDNQEEKKNENNNKLEIQHGKKANMALKLIKIPFMKFRINPNETIEEIIYIFSKKNRTLNEAIYLQHFLNLYDPKNFKCLKSDNIDLNEIMFNFSLCLNMHKYQKKEIPFKFGDLNDKIFLLLKGNVSLLEPVEKKCFMTLEQYVDYLHQLIDVGEFELVKRIIEKNLIYKNYSAIVKIKNNNEKDIKRANTENMKIKRGINKLYSIASIEFNLNYESKVFFQIPNENVYPREIITIEDYKKRVMPKFIENKEKVIGKNTKIFLSKENKDSSDKNNSHRPGHIITFYSYVIKKNVSTFGILNELPKTNESFDKNIINNENKKRVESNLTAICNETSLILYLNINTLEKIIKQRQESITMKNIASILEIPFFKKLNSTIFKEKYFKFFNLYTYKNGEYIFKKGEKMKNIYFIKSGEIELTMEASMYDINKILENIDKKNKDEIKNKEIEDKIKNKRKVFMTQEDVDNRKIMNRFKKDKNSSKWRIMRINYKDVICLNEILDLNNKYYIDAKCMSYFAEIYVIDYINFCEVINDDKGVKGLFGDYCIKKEKLIYERLKTIQDIYINDKFKIYKKKVLSKLSLNDMDTTKLNNLEQKRNDINLDLINNLLENSLSARTIRINSDNINNTINKVEPPFDNQYLSLSSTRNNNKLRNMKYSAYKTKISSATLSSKNFKTLKEFRSHKNLIKIKKKKNLNLMDENEELLNERFNSENGIKIKNPKFKRNESYFGLVKFKDFHNLTKTTKYSDKKNMKISSEINPNFSKYLKEVKKHRLDSTKKPKINPFSKIFFPFQKDNINIKSNFINLIRSSNKSENFNFNRIECLILDKFIDEKEYNKNNEKTSRFSVDGLKRKIRLMKQKNKFPQHLIRRLEGERKINYFPEKLLNFQNKKGIYFLG